jgi:hypothetical protein
MQKRTSPMGAIAPIAFVAAVVVGGCSGSSNAPATTSSSCTSASQCYPGVDAGALRGTPACLTSVGNGYCTHTCASNADCCSGPDNCAAADIPEICGSFESSGANYCFVSCAATDLPAGTTDANAFCARAAGGSSTCRSSGGGTNNTKFCG